MALWPPPRCGPGRSPQPDVSGPPPSLASMRWRRSRFSQDRSLGALVDNHRSTRVLARPLSGVLHTRANSGGDLVLMHETAQPLLPTVAITAPLRLPPSRPEPGLDHVRSLRERFAPSRARGGSAGVSSRATKSLNQRPASRLALRPERARRWSSMRRCHRGERRRRTRLPGPRQETSPSPDGWRGGF